MSEFWIHIEAFFEILLTRNVLAEISAVAVCLLIGGLLGATLRDRYRRRGVKTPTALTFRYFATQGIVVVAPVVVALTLVVIARALLYAAPFDVTIMDAAIRLIFAYVVVRVGVLLFAASLGNKSWMQHWENRFTLIIWLAIAAEYLGWLDPIINTLDSIGITSGKNRFTVWSTLKLLFTLTLFVLVATWISRWLDQRLKKMSTLAPSTRIGIAKFANAFLIALSILMGLNAA
jgi:small-conductance mechanosensitive channel